MIFVSCWLPELLGSLIKSHLQSCARDLKQHLHFLLLRTLVCSAARNVDLPSLKSNFQHPAGFLVFWTGKKKNTPEWRRVWGESFFHSARMLAVSKTSCTVNEGKKNTTVLDPCNILFSFDPSSTQTRCKILLTSSFIF